MPMKRFYGAATMTALVLAVTLPGCGAEDELCCTEFKAGATIGASIGGSAQAQVAVQAVADFAGIAAASIDDLTTACRSIAQDLDAPADTRKAAEGLEDKKAQMQSYCAIAVKAIGTIKAAARGRLTVVAKAPTCSASVSAKADCQAKCSGSAQCDVKANPPKCTGGKLEIACKGECTAQGSATVKCEGECTGNCQGSCTAKAGGVACNGKCEGTCRAGGTAGGTGIQADGTCKGTCEGTCEVTAPNAKCSGSCNGTCSASCKASASGSVKCDGKCSGDFEPLKCEGGKLEGGCKVDAKCDANCNASLSAKAECTPPAIEVTFAGAANLEAAGKLEATLKANLGVVLAFKARLAGMASLASTIGGSAGAVTDIKAVCIPQVVAAGTTAVANVQASAKATADIATAVGVK